MATPAEAEAAERVRRLLAAYEPPSYAEVPTADAALFLAAIDHRTGYASAHLVDGSGPFEGSALLWALGLRAERRRPGTLSAGELRGADAARVAALFSVAGESVIGADTRAALWRDLAAGVIDAYGGRAEALIAAAGGRLGGEGGLLARLARFEAYADPLRKKSMLVCKIWERRGWLAVSDPESWEVCADNVLMRLALRAGLVAPADPDRLRAATRDAWGRVAALAGVSPPVLDDLLWERGREDPDLIGSAAGDLREPERPPGTVWY